jgi:hypothetical protein
MNIFVLQIIDRDDFENMVNNQEYQGITTHPTREDAWEELGRFVKADWYEELDGILPESDQDAIEKYFDSRPSRKYLIYECWLDI